MNSRPAEQARFGATARVLLALASCASGLTCCEGVCAGPPTSRRPVPAAARPRPVVDHEVVPAGGLPCRNCGPAPCPLHGGHADECRDGLCAPHCPVRPSEHGFYRTQWRRWPGQGVMPASAEQAATPAAPPPVQVPTADEESPRPPVDEPLPPDDAEGRPSTAPVVEEPVEPMPAAPSETPAAEAPRPAPTVQPPVPPTPPGEPPVPPGAKDPEPGPFDGAEVPSASAAAPVEVGALRYPVPIGRVTAAGAAPWELRKSDRQRSAALRGL